MINEFNFLHIIISCFGISLFFTFFNIIILRIFNYRNEIYILFSTFVIFLFFLQYFTNNFYITLLVALFNFSFIVTYPALREEIPTFKILRFISTNKHTQSIILLMVLKEISLDIKVKEALSNNLIFTKNNRLYLTYFGLLLAKFFILFRKILNLNKL